MTIIEKLTALRSLMKERHMSFQHPIFMRPNTWENILRQENTCLVLVGLREL